MGSSGSLFLSGNEALARGAWEAGVKVAAAYPGTPSTEILEAVATYPEIDAQWSVNEKVAYEVAYGAAMGGVRSLFACKHVGLNVAMDPLMTSVYTGVNGGMAVIVADDPGMHSSQNEQDTRWVGPYAKVPVLEPSCPSEAIALIKAAFEMSEEFDTPVLVRTTTRVSHSKENTAVATRTEAPHRGYAVDWTKYVMVPGNARKRHAVVEQRLVQLAALAETTPLNRVEEGTGTGFITSSVSYHYVKERFLEGGNATVGVSVP